jgi:hypothetical protein
LKNYLIYVASRSVCVVCKRIVPTTISVGRPPGVLCSAYSTGLLCQGVDMAEEDEQSKGQTVDEKERILAEQLRDEKLRELEAEKLRALKAQGNPASPDADILSAPGNPNSFPDDISSSSSGPAGFDAANSPQRPQILMLPGLQRRRRPVASYRVPQNRQTRGRRPCQVIRLPIRKKRKRHAEAAPTVQNSNSDSRSLTAARSKASGSKLPPHHSSSCSWSS